MATLSQQQTQIFAEVPDSAEETRPIAAGEAVPALKLETVDGETFDLNEAIAKKPTVLIFYRGGWCPFCNRHLADVPSHRPQCPLVAQSGLSPVSL